MTLVERLRTKWELVALDQERKEAADRIEALEAALRKVIEDAGDPYIMTEIARAALEGP